MCLGGALMYRTTLVAIGARWLQFVLTNFFRIEVIQRVKDCMAGLTGRSNRRLVSPARK